MAKFCTKCGRPLEEGEMCHCDDEVKQNNNQDYRQNAQGQNNNQSYWQSAQGDNNNQNYQQNSYQNYQQNSQKQNNYQYTNEEGEFSKKSKAFFSELKNVLKMVVPIMKSPVKEIRNIMNTQEKTGFYMIVIHMIAITIAAFIVEEVTINGIFYSVLYRFFGYSILRFIIATFVFVGAIDFMLAGILLFTTKIIFNYETSYNKMITLVGGMAIPNAAIVLAGAVVSIIFEGLGAFIILLGMAFSALILVFCYSESVKLDVDKKIYALLISFTLLIILTANLVYLAF